MAKKICDQQIPCRICLPKEVLEIFGTAPTGIILLDENGLIIYINPRAHLMLGEAVRGALGKPVIYFIEAPRLMDWLMDGTSNYLAPFPWEFFSSKNPTRPNRLTKEYKSFAKNSPRFWKIPMTESLWPTVNRF